MRRSLVLSCFTALAIIVLLCILLPAVLTGCGNRSVTGIGDRSYEKVHVDTYHYSGCLTIKKWHDDEMGIEVNTEEVGSLFLSEGTYILIDSECPFCDKE